MTLARPDTDAALWAGRPHPAPPDFLTSHLSRLIPFPPLRHPII